MLLGVTSSTVVTPSTGLISRGSYLSEEIVMKADIDIMDINPIVDVGTAKNPMYVLDATWMTVLYEKATGRTSRVTMLM